MPAHDRSWPILVAIDPIAAHCDSYSPWCSNTTRTARSRTSGECLVCLLMAPSSQGFGASGNPGAVQNSPLRAAGWPRAAKEEAEAAPPSEERECELEEEGLEQLPAPGISKLGVN